MPAPGDQHLSSGGKPVTNPFDEVKPHISEYTAQEIATLQSRLEKQLGPEYISSRAGPSGQKVHYLAAEKCIQLANEVFGFNGWSSQIKEVQVDFVEENPTTLRVNLGLSVIVRVTLRDGTYHEDIGYGHMENAKGKAAAFEKAKKEGTTDGLKRALRNFGNVLGNCIYDKDYLKNVNKVKAAPAKFDVDKLHRHPDFVPVKREQEPKQIEDKSQNGATGASNISDDTVMEDEFGEFDDADFNLADPDAHPDEVVLTEPPMASHHFNTRNGNTTNRPSPNQVRPQANQTRPQANQQQPMAAPGRLPNMGNNTNPPPQPQTPGSGFSRSTSWAAGQVSRPYQEAAPQPRLQNPQLNAPIINAPTGRRVLNQPSRAGPPSAPVSPAKQQQSSADSDIGVSMPPQGAGFFSARGVAALPEVKDGQQLTDGPPPQLPAHLPSFNPHAESPSIRKTPGVDHKSSKPLTRDLKHVPGGTQVAATTGPVARPNVINPQLDATRRIGAPGSPSPMANRGQYKPPTLKRPGGDANAARQPLVDLPANGALGNDAGDAKRQRLNG